MARIVAARAGHGPSARQRCVAHLRLILRSLRRRATDLRQRRRNRSCPQHCIRLSQLRQSSGDLEVFLPDGLLSTCWTLMPTFPLACLYLIEWLPGSTALLACFDCKHCLIPMPQQRSLYLRKRILCRFRRFPSKDRFYPGVSPSQGRSF